ncbi:hypothetical protein QMK19_03275 [Streptomyces sp. H10-C2]|uniref:hypothetical protein n=1 Tax=unclassified Streptomyces TaxID=2593676 RepID=UPI0024BBA6A6|nr:MULTISPECIES: hypothetical protein [unclassified Streptomyces]MDJ0342207.1 hypothetical protein [Streptomyces sp. PH10-H1]MDJ0368721.1 hypothetical protein [Streptomyces sp. H10-C2]
MNLHALLAAVITSLVVVTICLAIYGAYELCHRACGHLQDVADQRDFRRSAAGAKAQPMPEHAFLVGDEPLEDVEPGSEEWLRDLFRRSGGQP